MESGAGRDGSLRSAGIQLHHRDGAADREDRYRRIKPQLPRAALSRSRNGDEGADLEAALSGIAPGLVIPVRDELLAAVCKGFPSVVLDPQ